MYYFLLYTGYPVCGFNAAKLAGFFQKIDTLKM